MCNLRNVRLDIFGLRMIVKKIDDLDIANNSGGWRVSDFRSNLKGIAFLNNNIACYPHPYAHAFKL